MSTLIKIDNEYAALVARLCKRFKAGQIKAAVRVNCEMIRFYYDLGCEIVTTKADAKWGSKFMKNLSEDLKHEMPDVTGLSETNLGYAKRFYQLYSSVIKIHPQVGDEFPTEITPEFHPQVGGELFELPWGHHKYIIDKCYSDYSKAIFFVHMSLKDGWSRAVLLNMLGTYITAVNHILKTEYDNPTIGLLICKEKDNVLARYAVESSSQPIGISEYEFQKVISADYKSSLPSIEEIELEVNQNS